MEIDSKEFYKMSLAKKIKRLPQIEDDEPDNKHEKAITGVSGLVSSVLSKIEQITTYLNNLGTYIQSAKKVDDDRAISLLQAIEKVKPPPQAGKWRFDVVRNEQGLISSVKAVRE